mgnify:CR=1 FL=1
MRNYTTQMDAARKGIVTPEIEAVAKKEHMTSEALMKLVAEGKVAICANRESYLLESGGSRQHAAYQDQRKSRGYPETVKIMISRCRK